MGGQASMNVASALGLSPILQGEADKTDPLAQSQMLYRALKRYGVKTDFVVYPREGHGITEEKHAVDVLERMLAWFDENMSDENIKSRAQSSTTGSR
jgi:esterase/lipase